MKNGYRMYQEKNILSIFATFALHTFEENWSLWAGSDLEKKRNKLKSSSEKKYERKKHQGYSNLETWLDDLETATSYSEASLTSSQVT